MGPQQTRKGRTSSLLNFQRKLLERIAMPALSVPGSSHHVTVSLPETSSTFEQGNVFFLI